MTYYANFKANNGTRWARPCKYTNKAEAIRDIRETAEAERFQGNECEWCVWINKGRDAEGCPIPSVVAAGGTWSNGQRWRASEEDLKRGYDF